MVPEGGLEQFVRIKLSSHEADAVNFNVGIRTKLDKIKQLYAQCQGLAVESLRLFFNGRRINGADITPWNLDLKDGDLIEVFVDKSIGLTSEDELFVRLVGFGGEERLFKMGMSTRMGELRKWYGECVNVAGKLVRLQVKSKVVEDEMTPWSLNMKDRDEITAFLTDHSKHSQSSPTSKHILVKVICPSGDLLNNEPKHLKIRSSTSIGQLIKYYSYKKDIAEESLAFMFKGMHVSREDTPEQLQMKDDDELQVVYRQQKVGQEDEKFVKIKAVFCENIWRFKVRPRTRMKKLKKTFSEQVGVHVKNLQFVFRGEFIGDDDTPEKLNMKDEIVIEVIQDRMAPKATKNF